MSINKNKHIVPISRNFKNSAIVITIVLMLISFIATATWFNGSIYIASFMSGTLIAILFLVIGIWKKRTWAIIASATFFYSFIILAISAFGNWPGFLDMAIAGATATLAMLITGVLISITIARKSWKKNSKTNKLAIIIAYFTPFVILLGGYFSGLAMDLRLKRFNILSNDELPATLTEIIYGNIGGIIIGIGVTIFLIINLKLIYTLLISKSPNRSDQNA